MSLFRCPSRFDYRHCEGWRWHDGWHHSTWTWWPFDPNAPAERRTVEWDDDGCHALRPVERGWQERTSFPTLGMFTAAEMAEGLQMASSAGVKVGIPVGGTPLDGPTGTDATREQAETDASPDEPASTCPTCGSSGPANGCLDAWHYTLPESTVRFEVNRTPLMKAHLALLRYGRHEQGCPWAYPPIDHTVCSCGLAEAIRKSCTNIEAEH